MQIGKSWLAENFFSSLHEKKKKKKFIFTWVAIKGTVLNPAISPKIEIWTAAIIINLIVKHHVLRIYQCRVLHENIKND